MSQLERIYAATALIACVALGVAAAPLGTEAIERGKWDTTRAFLSETGAFVPEVVLDDAIARAHALTSIAVDASDARVSIDLEVAGPRKAHYTVKRSAENHNLFLDLVGVIVLPEPTYTAMLSGNLIAKVTTQLLAVEPQFVTRVSLMLNAPVNFDLRTSGQMIALTLRRATQGKDAHASLAIARETLMQQEASVEATLAIAAEVRLRADAQITPLRSELLQGTKSMMLSLADVKVEALSSQLAVLSKELAAPVSTFYFDRLRHAENELQNVENQVLQLAAAHAGVRRNLVASLLVSSEGIQARIAAQRVLIESRTLNSDATQELISDLNAAGSTDIELFDSLLTLLTRNERNTLGKYESLRVGLREQQSRHSAILADARSRKTEHEDPLSFLENEVAKLRSHVQTSAVARLSALDAALEAVTLEEMSVPLEPVFIEAAITDVAPQSVQEPPRRRARVTTQRAVVQPPVASGPMRMLSPTDGELDFAEMTGMLVVAQANTSVIEASDVSPDKVNEADDPGRIVLQTARSNRPSFNLYNRDLPADEDPLQALVNIDFRQMDLTNVVSLLAQKGKISVIAGAEVSGSVTAKLQDIPLGRAIEIILRMNGLGIIEEEGVYRITSYDEAVTSRRETRMLFLKNASATDVQVTLSDVLAGTSASGLLSISANATTNVIILSGPRDLVEEYESIIARLDIAEPVIPTITVPIKLNYAEPQALLNIVRPLLTDAGKVTADLRGRHLIVTDLPVKVEAIQELIERIDLPVKQVSIEAMIVDALMSDDAQTGIDWILEAVRRTNRRGETVSDLQSISAQSDFTTGNITPGFVPGINLGSQLAFGILTGDFNIKAAIGAEVRSDNATLLANPVIVTVENKTARISIAEEIPYQELTQSTTGPPISSTEFKEVGTILEVTPRVTHDNHVIITIDAKQSDTKGESITGIPPEDVREAHTTVRVKNGQTIFIGGLRRFDDEVSVRKVPVLGDIPILSALFKNQTVKKESLELLIFLTCHVLSDDVPELTPNQKNWFDALGATHGQTPDATRSLLRGFTHPQEMRDPIYKWRRSK